MQATWVLLLLCSLLLASEACFRSSSGSSGSNRPPHDITTQAGLRRLYNERVTYAAHYWRPLGNLPRWARAGPVSHSGVVVTLYDGSRWLVHKVGFRHFYLTTS